MTTVAQLLAELDRRGITLTLTDSSLRYHPSSAMTPDLLAALTRHKAEVRDALLQAQADALLARCDHSLAWATEWARLHDRWGLPCHGFPTWAAWLADLARTA
jgi:hypothetical protein